MDESSNALDWLYVIPRPAFCVRDGKILHVNQDAQRLFIEPGADIGEMLATGAQEYAEYTGGSLYLTLRLPGVVWDATVMKVNGFDLFLLEPSFSQAGLQAMALSAMELRKPLTDVMGVAGELFTNAEVAGDPKLSEYEAKLNRSLFQLLRLVCNMSDAGLYAQNTPKLVTTNITHFIQEIMEKTQNLVGQTGHTLHFKNLDHDIFTMVDQGRLERAILNLISNAVKFSPAGSTITVTLTATDRMLSLTIQDSGSGVPESLRSNIFSRYQREPGISRDGRIGIGLGMALIRSAATAHGGTVLLDYPEDQGLIVKVTISRKLNITPRVDSQIRSWIDDYTGGWDHGLTELSDALPASAYHGAVGKKT